MNEVEESLSKMPFYNIKINDTDNAIIFGSKVNYCYYESCPLQKIRGEYFNIYIYIYSL